MALSTDEWVDELNYFWRQLVSESTVCYDDSEYDGQLVWQGALTRWFTDRNVSTQKYGRIKAALVGMKCIDQVVDGNKYRPTVVLMLQEPTKELYIKANADGALVGKGRRLNTQDKKIKDLTDQVTELASVVEILWNERQAALSGT